MLFKDRLKELREDRNLTQKNVAQACDLTPTCICQLETGARNPTGSTLVALAEFFDVSIDYLMGLESDIQKIDYTPQAANKFPQGEPLSTEERELVDAYRALNVKNKMHVNAYVTVRLEEQKTTPSKKA